MSLSLRSAENISRLYRNLNSDCATIMVSLHIDENRNRSSMEKSGRMCMITISGGIAEMCFGGGDGDGDGGGGSDEGLGGMVMRCISCLLFKV